MRLATFPLVGILGSTVLCISLCVVAQEMMGQEKPVPSSEVDQALRERVSQFMQFTVDRAYSKAYPLVAEDTKDFYLSSGKPQITKFKIQGIEYTPDLQQATVTTLVTRVLSMQGREISSEIPITYLWKMEGGKWMWTHDPDVLETPFGPVKIDRSAPSHVSAVPKNVDPDAVAEQGKNLKLEATSDKPEVVFVRGTAGSDQVVIHNGFPGTVEFEADIVGDYGAFLVQPAHSQVPAGKDVVLTVSYKPLDRSLASSVRVQVQPFNRTLMVPLRTTASSSTPAR